MPAAARVLIAALASLVAAPTAAADERPETSNLVLAGLAMAIPTYAIGVVAHEGSHALAAKISGARVTRMSLVPGLHPVSGKFYFGYVDVRGLRCDRQRVAFYLAPKLTDALALGAYALAYHGGAMPVDRYGQLALTVLATGFWIDFSKDVVAFWDHNDVVKVYRLAGADDELERLPYRLLHAGLSVAGGVAIVQGYRRIFAATARDDSTTAAIVPLWLGAF